MTTGVTVAVSRGEVSLPEIIERFRTTNTSAEEAFCLLRAVAWVAMGDTNFGGLPKSCTVPNPPAEDMITLVEFLTGVGDELHPSEVEEVREESRRVLARILWKIGVATGYRRGVKPTLAAAKCIIFFAADARHVPGGTRDLEQVQRFLVEQCCEQKREFELARQTAAWEMLPGALVHAQHFGYIRKQVMTAAILPLCQCLWSRIQLFGRPLFQPPPSPEWLEEIFALAKKAQGPALPNYGSPLCLIQYQELLGQASRQRDGWYREAALTLVDLIGREKD